MNILQIAPQIPFPIDQGGRISIYGITKYLSMRGHKIHLISYTKDTIIPPAVEELSKYAELHFLDEYPRNNMISAFFNLFSDIPYNISKFYSPVMEGFLRKFIPSHQIDILHVDHLHMAWVIDIIRQMKDIPAVLREHNFELKIMHRYFKAQKNPILKMYSYMQYLKFIKYEPSMAEKFDRCIMISPVDEKELKSMNPKIKTVNIPVGVESAMLNKSRQKIEPYSMFHLGALNWFPNYEGLKWFIDEVFPSILKKIPEVKFYIYGEDSDKLSVSHSLKKNIIPVGYVKDIWPEILSKDLAVVPLRIGSGMRIKIIEMLAAGQIIASTSIGKEGIDVCDEKNILLGDSSEELSGKIIEYFENKYSRTLLSSAAKDLVRSKYTWENIAVQLEAEYQDVINNRRKTF